MNFLYVFLIFLLGALMVRQWLSWRQIRYVARHRNQLPPEFAQSLSLHAHQRAADYTIAKEQLRLIEGFVDTAVVISFTLLGGLQALDLFWARHVPHELWRQIGLVMSVLGISALISLPFRAWSVFKIEAHFGFNRLTPKLFLRDTLLGLGLMAGLGVACLAVILSLMQLGSHSWPLYAWGFWVLFNLLLIWAYPAFIAPLFNRFQPLDRPELQNRIQGLVQRCGFTLAGLFVMDGSRRSSHGNAYFTGLGNLKRIVFFDTLLSRLNDEEVEAVLAHELGHFKHKHILKRMLVNFGGALVFFFALAWLSQKVWFYTSLGVLPQLAGANDGLALVLFFICVPVFTFWLSPVSHFLSRKNEYEADAYAIAHTQASALRNALLKLYKDNAATLTPDPVYSSFYDTHPPALQRIRFIDRHDPTSFS